MKKIVSCLIAVNLMLLPLNAFAEFKSASFDRDANVITVSGNAGENMGNKLVSVVLKSDGDVKDIELLRTDENADFEWTFKIADKTAVYEVLYQTPKTDNAVSTTVQTYSSQKVGEILNGFTTAATKDDMSLIFADGSEYIEILGISHELIGEILDYDKFYTAIAEKSASVTDVNSAAKLINETAIVQIFNETQAAQMSELVEKYSGLIGISASGLYENYIAFNESEKADFETKLKNYTFTSLQSIVDAFEISALLTEIQHSEYYTDTQLIVEKYSGKLSINMTSYNGLSDKLKKDVMKAITGNNSLNTQEFTAAWDNAVRNVINSGYAGNYQGGGGGGSSSGGSMGTIKVEVPREPIKNVSFVDMDDAMWAKEAVVKLANDGVVSGKSEYHFCPNDNITRAEFVKMLIGALGFEIKTSEHRFDDVAPENWAYPYICTAVENGIVFGYSESEFGAGGNITRQDMITMLIRALKLNKNIGARSEYELPFDDTVEIDGYALDNVKTAVYYKLVSGMGDNCFKPKACATRAQAAMIIYQSTKANFNN